MKHVLLAALLLLQIQGGDSSVAVGVSPYPGFHPKSSGPFVLEINQESREAFQMIAEQAGLNVVFLRDFQSLPVQLKLDNVSLNEALDKLCAGSKSFWQPYDNKTIVVAYDTPTNHRDLEVQRLTPFFPRNMNSPQDMRSIMTTVRQELAVTTMSSLQSPGIIVTKDTPGKVTLAQKRFEELDKSQLTPVTSYEMDAAGSVFVIEGGDRRNMTPRRSRLQPSTTGPFSFDFNQPTRSAFEAIAAKAGLTAVFERGYPDSTVTMKLKDVDIDAALDLLSMAAGTYGSFWQPYGSKTIFIASGSSTAHRTYDSLRLDVIHLTGAKTVQEVSDVMNTIRQTLNITTMTAVPGTNTLVFKDTPAKAVLAEWLISEIDGQMSGILPGATRAPMTPALSIEIEGAGALNGSGSISIIQADGARRNITPSRSQLQPKTTRPFSLRMTEDVQRAYEILGETGGIHVRFDSNFKPGPAKIEFRFDNVDIFDALDILSLQTRSFWQVEDSGAIVIADDSSATRRAIEPQIQRTFRLSNVATVQGLTNIVNSVGQTVNLSDVKAIPESNTIEVRDTLNKVTLAEKLIGALDRLPAARQ